MKKILFKFLLIICFCGVSLPVYSDPITSGYIISKAKNAADDLIQSAFDRLDLTVLQAAMEARALVDEVASSFQDVMTSTIDELDEQQKRAISDLQDFERLERKGGR